MATEFRTSVVLDAKKATAQAAAFGKAVSKTSNILDEFQKKTLAVTQGGSKNVFRKYENSLDSLDIKMRNAVARVHSMKRGTTDNERALKKLTRTTKELTSAESKRKESLERAISLEQKAVRLVINLNKKYDENARVVSQAKRIRNELNLVVASGMKTKKEALVIFKREVEALRKSTKAYKDRVREEKAAVAAKKKEMSAIDNLLIKYDKEYAAKQKLRRVNSELNSLVRSGRISQSRSNELLKEYIDKTKEATKAQDKRNRSVGYFQRVARNFSIATRIMLGGYAAIAAVKGWININKTAESITLLQQKLELLTGDSGAYAKMSSMASRIGIKLTEAGKIITRFAVVTNKAFSIETMSLWTETLTKSARATGTSTQEMTGALIQITQAMSAGRLMGDEYRSVTENLPLFTVALRKVFSSTNLSLKELSSQGVITNDRLIEGFEILKDMVEGIPGTTGTVEAQLNSLGNAWDEFINRVTDTSYVKRTLTGFTVLLNAMKNAMDTPEQNRIAEQTEKVEIIEKAVNRYNKLRLSNIFGQKVAMFDEGVLTTLSPDNIGRMSDRLREEQAELEALLKRGGKTLAQIRKAQASQEASDAHKLELARQKAEADNKEYYDLMGGESVATLRNVKDVKVESLKKKYLSDESSLEDRERGLAMILKLEQDFQDKVSKIAAKSVNEKVKIYKRKYDTNRADLLEEKVYTGTVVSINKAFAKDINKIDEELLRGREEAKEGLAIGETGGIEAAQGAAEKAALAAKAEAAISLAIQKTEASIDSLTAGGKGKTDYENYLGRVSVELSNQKKRFVALKEYYRDSGKHVDRLGRTHEEAKEHLKAFNEQQLEVIKDEFVKKYENSFSKRLKALRDQRDETDNLTQAQKFLTMTSEEVAYHQEQIDIRFKNSTESANALVGSYNLMQGALAGISRGFRDFQNKSIRSYDIMSEYSKKFLDETEDAFGRFFIEGSSVFDDLAKSAKKMVEDVIVELLKLAAKPFIIRISAIGASLLGGSGSAFAGGLGGSGGGSGGSVIDLISKGYSALTTDFGAMLNGSALSTSIDNLANGLFNMGFDTAGNSVMDVGMGLSSAGGGNALLGGLYTAGAGFAGGYGGTAIGEAIFNKKAESALGASGGATIGAYVGSIIPGIGTVIGAAVGGLIGGIVDVITGGDGKERFALGVRTGFDAKDIGGGQEIGGSGIVYSGYAKRAGGKGLETTTSLVASFAALDTSLTNLYGLMGTSIDLTGQSLVGKAHQAGKSGGDFFGSAEFNGISSSDLSGMADAFLTAWADAVEAQTGARIDIEPLKALETQTESLSSVIDRLQVEFVAVKGASELLGLKFSDLSVQGLIAAGNIVKAAGGLEQFSQAASFYYDNFYTEHEKANEAVMESSKAISDFNKTFGTTINNKSGLRSYIDGLDRTTKAGQEAFGAALTLAPAIVKLEEAMGVLGVTVDSKTKAQTELDSAESALSDAQSRLSSAREDMLDAYSRELSDKKDYISNFIEIGKSLHAASKGLALSGLSPLTPQQRLNEARKEFNETFKKAQSGDQDAMKRLASVSEVFLTESRAMFASSTKYTKDFNMVRAALESTGDLAFKTASTEEKSLSVMQDQFKEMSDANDTLNQISKKLSVANAAEKYNREKAALKEAQASVDKAKKSVDSYTSNSASDSVSASSSTEYIPLTDEQFLDQLYVKGFGRKADVKGFNYWMERLSSGMSRFDVLNYFENSKEAIDAGFDSTDIRLYKNGGISNKPAIFGEAGTEAAVPLPDGRSIPVTLRGSPVDNSDVVDAIIASAELASLNSRELKEEIAESKRELSRLNKRIAMMESSL